MSFWEKRGQEQRDEVSFGIRLKRLELDAFRPFNRLIVDFDDDLTVFIGDNGSGKTTILDATAEILKFFVTTAIYSDYPTSVSLKGKDVKNGQLTSLNYLTLEARFTEELDITEEELNEIESEYREAYKFSKENREIKIGFEINKESGKVQFLEDEGLSHFEKAFKRLFRDEQDNSPVLIYYGCNALDTKETSTISWNNEYISKRHRIFEDSLSSERTSFSDFYKWFDNENKKTWQNSTESTYLDLVKKTIVNFLNDDIEKPNYQNLRIDYRRTGDAMLIDMNTANTWIPVEVGQMSAGQKSMIALIGDLMRRMIEANSSLENPFQGYGIVLIDEVDLHLHPLWQRKVVAKLRELFPNIQFVVTTHSPFVVSSSNLKNIRTISYGTIEEVNGFIDGVRGKNVGEILYKLMGVVSSFVDNDIIEIYKLLKQKRLIEAESMIKTIKENIEGYNDDVEIIESKIRQLKREI